MLQFIFGRAATGKTTYINRLIKENDDKAILLVPEQFSFETEKEMLDIFGGGFMNKVEVFSFTRLVDTVGRLYGGNAGARITDSERIMFLCRAVKNQKHNFKYYKGLTNISSFVSQISGIISELKMAGILNSDLPRIAGEMDNSVLGDKLFDISLIFSAYDKMIKGTYSDPLDDLEFLYNATLENAFFNGKTVYIDAFKGFTGSQIKILKLMILNCKNVVISFCCDGFEDFEKGAGTFSNIKAVASYLKNFADENNIKTLKSIYLKKPFYSSNELYNLEKLMAFNTFDTYEKETCNVCVSEFDTPDKEINFVFKMIHKLVRTENYSFGDFVVIARDIDKYKNQIAVSSKKFKTPCYMDVKRELIFSPVARFALSCIKAAANFNTEDILCLLKTGLTSIKDIDISLLEEYVYIWDINKTAWNKEWTMNPNGFITNEEDRNAADSAEKLSALNRIRKSVVFPLLKVKKSFTGNCKDITEALYNCIIELKADEAVKKLCNYLLLKDDKANADYINASWDEVINTFDSMVRCFSNESFSIGEYSDLLEMSFKNTAIGSVPVMLDEVSVGSADRIRPARPKVVFVIGLCQGEFPRISDDKGLLSRYDRKALIDLGVQISDRFKKSAVDEKYLLYAALCCSCEKVFATYHLKKSSGEATEKCFAAEKINSCFLNQKDYKAELELYPETVDDGFYMLAENYNNNSKIFATLKDYFENESKYCEKAKALKNVNPMQNRRLNENTCKNLFNNDLFLSPSKIEIYNKCAFRYFCSYVLNVSRLQKADLNNLQRGTIVHYVLENVLKQQKDNIKFITKDEISESVDMFMEKYLKSISGYEYLENSRFKFVYGEIAKMIKYIILHISKEFANSDFSPVDFELEISNNSGKIPSLKIAFLPGKNAVISGKIDRVDVFKDKEYGDFVRIVDYKTGKMIFSLPDVLFGLNLQMLLYLYAINKTKGSEYEKMLPAGVLYMPSNRGIITSDGKDPLTMNGMLLNDERVIAAMDKNNLGCFIPKPPKGERKTDPFVKREDFETVFKYLEQIVKKTALNISSGIFDVNPRDSAAHIACDYCDFASVCCFEDDLKHNEQSDMTDSEVLGKMKEACNNEIQPD